jgi:hypothetical protein
LSCVLACLAIGVPVWGRSPAEDRFEKRVRPLLAARCVRCHGPQKAKAGLRLDSAAGLARGGKRGAAIVPGKPEKSLLIEAVQQSGDLKMPPSEKLQEQEIADLTLWIRSGAAWPGPGIAVPMPAAKDFWAFQPVKAVEPPAVRDLSAVKSPVDRFILARLEAVGLRPALPADKRTLLRRVSFDLTGLPPTPAEIDAFLADDSPDAFARVVDRLLASPHYGERWGRHWLDVVRFAESTANDANAVMRYAWRYRDYVVAAFNKDKPYDQFIIEQLGGDLLPAPADARVRAEQVIATGFLMIGPKALAETDKEQSRLDIVDDQLDVTGRAFLGLTIGCARCHDHKFDPIPTLDYYALAGIFRSTEVFRDENRNASFWQEWELPAAGGEPPLVVMAPKEGNPTDLRVHLRGNRHNLGQPAPRQFLHVLGGDSHPLLNRRHSGRLELARWIAARDNPLTARVLVNRVWQHHFGTGLVATSDNFGSRGEKPSHPELLDWLAGDFVRSGWSIKALHKRLLLSASYQMSDAIDPQAIKIDPNARLLWRMPRQRLEGEAIRDAMLAISGRLDSAIGGNDSGELLFKEGEVIDRKRDFFRPNRVQADHAIYTTSRRRSLYLPVVRNAQPDLLALFDGADPNGVTAVRNDTTVASQAMFLLNHPFVREQAMHFARRLLGDPASREEDHIAAAYRLALGRMPQAEECHEAIAFLQQYAAIALRKGRKAEEARLAAWQSFCQSLLTRNEFLYVE